LPRQRRRRSDIPQFLVCTGVHLKSADHLFLLCERAFRSPAETRDQTNKNDSPCSERSHAMHLTNTASNFDAEREESRAGFVKEA
jgi:hypothetical protein